jgi:hypothetical protein
MFTGPEPVLGCDLTNGHNTLGNICCDAPRDDLTHRTGKESELSFHILHERDALATLRHFLPGSASRTQRILGKLTKDQSWPLVSQKDLD